ncbi:class C sortase [Bifidobacterium sp. 64T4]|uniref:class C sortase n=1 Tax=Bifidobacterium pongonis TaxID=2834432 RepID=UPI001C55D6F8|nr:class C sortase [Bifidobacterium pongonis]MBW3095492.1 class C sortase [Bifidobacterium pongonis]
MADNASRHSRPGEHAGEGGGATGTTGRTDMTGKTGKARKGNGARGGKTRGKGGNVWSGILAALLVIGGIAVFAYPSVADMLATREHTEVIDSYQKKTAAMPSKKVKAELGAARTYNENLSGDPVHDPFVSDSGYVLPTNYANVLNVNHDGVMGYLSINRISLRLPIYHGTSEDVLAKGVGHMSQTSLPIGGKGTHAVLTGHRGLPSAELFTRLGEMRKGDLFRIEVLGRTVTYKVTDISVVEPNDVDKLVIEPGKDLVTLLTCTPYGVNTQRLLVTGERTANVAESEAAGDTASIPTSPDWWVRTCLLIGGAVLAGTLGFAARHRRCKTRAAAAGR